GKRRSKNQWISSSQPEETARCTKLRVNSWAAEFRWRFCLSARRTIWRAASVSPNLLTKFFNRFTAEKGSRSTSASRVHHRGLTIFWKRRAAGYLQTPFLPQRPTKKKELRRRKNSQRTYRF